MPKNLKISVFILWYKTMAVAMFLKSNRTTEHRLSILLCSNVREEQSSRHHLWIHRHGSKKGKKQELELMYFLNRRLLWLTWLLPNLNSESQKVHGLYMLLALACLAVRHQRVVSAGRVTHWNWTAPCSLCYDAWGLWQHCIGASTFDKKKIDFAKPMDL